jgi:hypothetical protein
VELIPDSELAVIQGGAHGFLVENFGTFNRLVLVFLARVAAEQHSLLASTTSDMRGG